MATRDPQWQRMCLVCGGRGMVAHMDKGAAPAIVRATAPLWIVLSLLYQFTPPTGGGATNAWWGSFPWLSWGQQASELVGVSEQAFG